jgi:hypothetical protein
MPKELPRHELKKEFRKESEGTYREAELSATHRGHSLDRDIKNPEKRQARSATRVLEEALRSLTDANIGLAKLYSGSGEGFLGTPGGEDWKAKARACGTDLAGYFNDNKLVLEAGRPRSKDLSPEQIDLQRLLDCLELAEQKGGIGDWLAQWNALMRDPFQRTDISRMADIAESIRAGIEFQKALIRELDLLEKEGVEVPPEADEGISLLNSIAYEISRQLGEALNNRFEAGSKLAGARNTLKRNSDRERLGETVRQAIEKQSVNETMAKWSSRSAGSTTISPIIDPVVSNLMEWDKAATQMSELVQTVGTADYPGAATEKATAKLLNQRGEVVKNIGKAVDDIFNLNIALPGRDGISIVGKEQVLFTLGQIANGLFEKQRSYAKQLTNQDAREILVLGASAMATVCATIEKKRQDPHLPRFHERAITAGKSGTLREFWSTNRDKILQEVKERGGADPAGKTALADLDALFKDNLGGKLDEWFKRQKNPDDVYGLAWQLVATLREYQKSATRILNEWMDSFATGDKNRGVAQLCRESMDQLLDSIIAAVAQDLDEDVAAG